MQVRELEISTRNLVLLQDMRETFKITRPSGKNTDVAEFRMERPGDNVTSGVAKLMYASFFQCDPELLGQLVIAMELYVGSKVEVSGGMFYPANIGYMGWHTNENRPGDRWYFSWTREPGQGNGLRFIDEDGVEQFSEDVDSIMLRHFEISENNKSNWHCVPNGRSERYSLGFKKCN